MDGKSKRVSWNREQYNYYFKIKSYIHLIGIGIFLLLAIFPIISMSLFLIQSPIFIEITLVWAVLFFIYWMAIPLFLQFLRHYGIGIWMSWDINVINSLIAYYFIFGFIIQIMIFIAFIIFYSGFHFQYLETGLIGIFLLFLTFIGIIIFTKYLQNENNRKKFIMIRDKEKSVKETFNTILKSLNLKSTKKWMGSRLTGYSILQIEPLSLNYKITQEYWVTTIEIESQIDNNEANIKKIETAISNYFGFKSDYL